MFRLFGGIRPTAAAANTADVAPAGLLRARLNASETVDEVIAALCETTRDIVESDGVTVIRREGDEVVYVGEDAISPLWTGQRFSIRTCISGMAILARAPIAIPDIMHDRRVPLNAYLATFVRSMAMVPIGRDDPQMAIGAYWQKTEPAAAVAIERLTQITAAAADALDRIEGEPPVRRQLV